eukprot:m.228201 g.228201  ORF g.228201 m.228201 type:complete len:84 (+) comp54246_c1_seq37:228-479(+)
MRTTTTANVSLRSQSIHLSGQEPCVSCCIATLFIVPVTIRHSKAALTGGLFFEFHFSSILWSGLRTASRERIFPSTVVSVACS